MTAPPGPPVFARQAEILRHGILQPLADLSDRHLGANVFLLAAVLVGASATLQVLSDVHLGIVGRLTVPWAVVDSAFAVATAWSALHLVRFQRSHRPTDVAVVHSLLRALEWIVYGGAAMSVLVLPVVMVTSFGRTHSITGMLLDSMNVTSAIVGTLGGLFGGCEWRSPPPRRERGVDMGRVQSAMPT